jgi:hypothetical protein
MLSESSERDLSEKADPAHLEHLRSLVERVMADGVISPLEADELRSALMADGQITADEVDLIRQVMREQLRDEHLEFE